MTLRCTNRCPIACMPLLASPSARLNLDLAMTKNATSDRKQEDCRQNAVHDPQEQQMVALAECRPRLRSQPEVVSLK